MIDWTGSCGSSRRDAAFGHAQNDRVAVNLKDQAQALVEIDRRLEWHQGFALATLNLDHVVKLRRDPAFCAAYAQHDLITADGNPVVWLSRIAGHHVSLIPGSALVEPVAELAALRNASIALLGATESSLNGAALHLETKFPGLQIVARIAPPMGFDPTGTDADATIMELQSSGAQLCFLALGAPKQELFAARARQAMPETGFLSVGAGLDFLSGTQKRAPQLVQALAAEWLWRLACNPTRLTGRYVACLTILPGLAIEAVRTRMECPH